jgi:hypothetical protein
VRPEENRNGWPFWRLTVEGRRRVEALANARAVTPATEQDHGK